MAKTQKDYEAEGGKMFRDGKAYPYSIADRAWQRKAMLRGYEDARSASGAVDRMLSVTAKALAPKLHSPRNSFTEQDRAMLHGLTEYMPHGAAAHVINLSQQLAYAMPAERRTRLRAKITTLTTKYSDRYSRMQLSAQR